MPDTTNKTDPGPQPNAPMRTIVMTGATAGIGLAAAAQMRHSPNIRLLLGARAQTAAGADFLPLDLARLASVRSFAAAVKEHLGEKSIDGLVLNAGTQFGNADQRTEDGFEATFAVNHLAHYLLLRLLMPRLGEGAIVVITTSDTHDPKTFPFAPPEHADAPMLARGQVGLSLKTRRSGLRAYAASKLCNLLTARALAASAFARERRLRVIAFNPGATPGTRLARNHSRGLQLLAAVLVPILTPVLRLNSVADGGDLLADLALGHIVPDTRQVYASQVKRRLTWPDPSELARDDTVMVRLWRDSAALVGLPEESQILTLADASAASAASMNIGG